MKTGGHSQKSSGKILLVDSFALLFRAYAALPPLEFNNQSLGAVYGFFSILWRFIEQVKPTHVFAAFDRPEITLRKQKMKSYKAQREAAPDDFYAQVEIAKTILEHLKIPMVSLAGYEADDIIGTLAQKYQNDHSIVVLTGDKDLLQLLTDNISVLTPKIGFGADTLYTPADFKRKYGFTHEHWIDYKALRGDPSDNLPGAKGIGDTIATDLITRFGNIDSIYQAVSQADETIKPRISKLLTESKDQVYLTKDMVTVDCQVPIEVELSSGIFPQYTPEVIINLVKTYGFKNLSDRLYRSLQSSTENTQQLNENQPVEIIKPAEINQGDYREVTESNWDDFYSAWSQSKAFAFDTETNSLNVHEATMLALSVSWQDGTGWCLSRKILIDHLDQICQVFAQAKTQKIAHNAKFDLAILHGAGIEVAGDIDDTMLMAYILRPGERGFGLKTLAGSRLGMIMTSYEDMSGGQELSKVAPEVLTAYAAADADATWRLFSLLKADLDREQTWEIYVKFERPLIPILLQMEKLGIKIDLNYLADLDKRFGQMAENLRQEIIKLAGEDFNVDSPKQLSEILFKRLKLNVPGMKKTKTGISTAANSLELLRDSHPIISLIEQYRELTKLLSTYIRVWPTLADGSGRVHTSFNQTVTATGRLSSTDPNLQNIPIRTEQGRELRRCIVAAKGFELLSIDYSQIELRVASALAHEDGMIAAFTRGEDIHAWTASQIHHLPIEKITKELRRTAKEINFGVLYGMGAYGVAQRTGLSRQESARFIETYFELFPKLKAYFDSVIDQAKAQGYVATFFGRKRYVPDLLSNQYQVRAGAERATVNLPMQGTAADIIKAAMIKIHACLELQDPEKKHCRLLSQVHDELLFEIKPEWKDRLIPELINIMLKSVDFPVPLKVEARVGLNWEETKPYVVK